MYATLVCLSDHIRSECYAVSKECLAHLVRSSFSMCSKQLALNSYSEKGSGALERRVEPDVCRLVLMSPPSLNAPANSATTAHYCSRALFSPILCTKATESSRALGPLIVDSILVSSREWQTISVRLPAGALTLWMFFWMTLWIYCGQLVFNWYTRTIWKIAFTFYMAISNDLIKLLS